jgi:flagellar biosynthesis protein FlhF
MDTDMRRVLSQIRADQGPDAVILSNRRVDGGIEVIAAVDYDEALVQTALGSQPDQVDDRQTLSGADAAKLLHRDDTKPADDDNNVISDNLQASTVDSAVESDAGENQIVWSQEPTLVQMRSEMSSMRALLETQLSGLVWKENSRRTPLRAQMLRNLSRIGLAPDVALMIANRTPPIEDAKDLWRAPLVTLAQTIPTVEDDLLNSGGVAALIGPTGVGKTTTIAKMAVRFAMTHGSDEIALISADAYRIGAKEHLEAFANIIGVNVHAASSADDLTTLLERHKSKKLVLIDTEGLSQRDNNLAGKLASYGSNSERVRFYLTLSAASQEAGLDETLRQFNKVPLAGAIVTKLDEAGQLGCVLSTLIRHNLPCAYLSDGQRVPDDLYAAQKKKLWLVNQAVECIELSEPRIDERTMAESYANVRVANA